MVNYC